MSSHLGLKALITQCERSFLEHSGVQAHSRLMYAPRLFELFSQTSDVGSSGRWGTE